MPDPDLIVIQKITSCPVCEKSSGVIELPQSLIRAIAYSVYERLEWAVILHGERTSPTSARVTDWSFPPQDRRGSTVDIEPQDRTLEELDSIVGVIHSHHSMSAFFSERDKTKLNPLYPISIVVAQYKPPTVEPATETPKQFTQRVFGWDYSAVGKFTLPCGQLGEMEYRVVPYDEEDGAEFEEWDYMSGIVVPVEPVVATTIKRNCNRYSNEAVENFMDELVTECGIRTQPSKSIGWFGLDDSIANAIEAHDAKQLKKVAKKQKQRNKVLTQNNGSVIIQPVAALAPVSVSAEERTKAVSLLKTANQYAARVNMAMIVGITLPTIAPFRDAFLPSMNHLSGVVKKIQSNPDVLKDSEAGMAIRAWFSIILALKTCASPAELIEEFTKPSIVEDLFFLLQELHTYATSTITTAPSISAYQGDIHYGYSN